MKRQYLSLIVLCGAYGNFASGMESPSQLALPKPGKLFSAFQEFANSPEETLTQEQLDILQTTVNTTRKSPNGLRSQIVAGETLLAFGNLQNANRVMEKVKSDSNMLVEKLKAMPEEERRATTYYLIANEKLTKSEDHGQADREAYKAWKELSERKKRLTSLVLPQLMEGTQILEQTAQQLHQTIEKKAKELEALHSELKTTTEGYRKTAENLYAAALAKKVLTKCEAVATNRLKQQFIDIQAKSDSLTEKKAKLEKSLAEDTLLPDVKASKQTQLDDTVKQIADTTKELHSAARDYKLATNTYTALFDKPSWRTLGKVYLPVFPKDKPEDKKEPIIVD